MIVPALLTDKREELIKMIDLCASFTDYVQVDIMDGKFVPSRSVDIKDLIDLKPRIRLEAHLMVNDPLSWLEVFKKMGAEKIIYHFEIDAEHRKIISEIKKSGLKAGIALNPETKIEEIDSFLDQLDTVLFMSVNPGFYGAEFIPEVLDKIRDFKRKFPDKFSGIDGGVKLDNLIRIKNSGVDFACVGSAILKASDPQKAYKELSELFGE